MKSKRRFSSFRLVPAAMLLLLPANAVFGQTTSRTSSSSGNSTSSRSSSSSSFGSGFSGQLGSGTSSFGMSNGTFGTTNGLTTTGTQRSGITDPFASARIDPQSMARAQGGNSTTGGGRNSQRAMQFGAQNMFGNQGGRGMNQNFGMNGQNQRRTLASTTIGFSTPVIDHAPSVAAVTSVLTPKSIPGVRDVNVEIRSGTAYLSGSVATQDDARLAAAILSLEPGVDRIENRLKVEAK